MSVIVKGSSTTFPPHPVGQFPARCIDVWDVGIIETQYGKKHRVAIRFYCGEHHTIDGERHPAFLDAYFNATLNEKASLRKFCEAWRGRPFTPEELEGFDLEKLVDAPAYVQVVHNKTAKGTYANIDTVMKLPPTMEAALAPQDYVRVKDRPTEDDDSSSGSAMPDPNDPDDDLPF